MEEFESNVADDFRTSKIGIITSIPIRLMTTLKSVLAEHVVPPSVIWSLIPDRNASRASSRWWTPPSSTSRLASGRRPAVIQIALYEYIDSTFTRY